jgi:hypothetical protein
MNGENYGTQDQSTELNECTLLDSQDDMLYSTSSQTRGSIF